MLPVLGLGLSRHLNIGEQRMNSSNVEYDPRRDSAAIEMSGVQKFFGTFQVLTDINLTINRGQKVIVCGPSGSGKSTLIRCINQLETFQSGKIVVDGINVNADRNSTEAVRREVGMVFQQFNLFPHLTVLENCILAPMRVRKASRKVAEETAKRFLNRVRIGDQAAKYPAQLSGGQQQRVAIARALCMEPKIMLFDEPTSALDPEMVNEVLETMQSLANDGMTMICVTHEMGFAQAVADRMIFMDMGRILEDSPPSEFFKSPQHDRARDFLRKIIH